MSELIAKHCTLLEQLKETNQYHQDRDDILNDFHTELNRLRSSNIVIFRQEINKVTTLLCTNIINLNELILTFFLDYFIQLLKQLHELTYFNDSNDSYTFENLSIILKNHSYNLMNELLVQEFIQCLITIARVGKDMFKNRNIEVITRMLNAYTDIESSNRHEFMEVSQLDDSIIKCLCTPYTIEVFAQFNLSVKSEERNPTEDFVFDGLFGHVSLMNREKLQEQALDLRKHLLASISNLLDTFEISYNEWSESAIKILTDLTTLFLYSVQMTIVNDICLDVQKHICDTSIRVLVIPTYRSMKFNNNCLQYIYMGTSSDKILDHLKSQKLTSTMFNIVNLFKSEGEIQFNVYRILAAIMTEDDIKRLDDPGAIAKVFLDHLTEITDRSGWEVRIKNLLTRLKILLQHDQIRDEIYKQNGVPLFIYCATVTKYDTIIQQRALENLLIMSFNEKVHLNLKENTTFMTQIKSISENSTEPDLQRAAESLLWILTKDETSKESIDNQTSETTYDIMISYSHKDKDLCFQLYDRLQKDNFRVWLDRDQIHGTPLESMSNAIENSEFVFLCMSDAYKQSGYCKMEAYYALERQCCIIPLVMKSQYRPDGWLGIVVTGRMRIDFPKYGFEDAYNKLMIEIDRNRREKKKDSYLHHHDIPATTTPSNISVKEDKVIEKLVFQAKSDHCLPSNIEQWTTDDTQQFLIKQQLENFLPICSRMNGTRLVQLYKMCMKNSPVMFQSLNNQFAMMNIEKKKSIIEIIEYFQFLDDLKPFVPISYEKTEVVGARSTVCILTLLNKALRIPEVDVLFKLCLFIQHLILSDEYIPVILHLNLSSSLRCAHTSTLRYTVNDDNDVLLNMRIMGSLIKVEKDNHNEHGITSIYLTLIESAASFVTLIKLMMIMGQRIHAEQLVQMIFDDETLKSDPHLRDSLAALCHILGATCHIRSDSHIQKFWIRHCGDFKRAAELFHLSLDTFLRFAPANALPCYLKSTEIELMRLPEYYSTIAVTHFNIATTYTGLGRFEEAIASTERSVEQLVKTLPSDHPEVIENRSYIETIKRKQMLKRLFDTDTTGLFSSKLSLCAIYLFIII
ncbi:unnamed protein product [Rotaria sp. Silwood2]|nr:unnamed protein product [Rotaria sp. Silwood2]